MKPDGNSRGKAITFKYQIGEFRNVDLQEPNIIFDFALPSGGMRVPPSRAGGAHGALHGMA